MSLPNSYEPIEPTLPASFNPTATVRVQGPLDAVAVEVVRRGAVVASSARAIRVECAEVSAIDPVGAACLWLLCLEIERGGRRLALVGLPVRFLHRMRLHPLMRFVAGDEEIFRDPFAAFVPSGR
jgi:ABC-type transporter Mla MlaB component